MNEQRVAPHRRILKAGTIGQALPVLRYSEKQLCAGLYAALDGTANQCGLTSNGSHCKLLPFVIHTLETCVMLYIPSREGPF